MLLRRCRDEFFLADRARAYEPLKLGAGGGNRLGRHVDGEALPDGRALRTLRDPGEYVVKVAQGRAEQIHSG